MVLDGQVVPASPVEETVEAGLEQLGIAAILTNNRLISVAGNVRYRSKWTRGWLQKVSRSAFKMIVMTCASVSPTDEDV